ncbi:hypothetical protein F4802DRAFT_51032 [Xylaria palmicola]|nr:hypothetical protein F4802DRAFT_51032 [Xylaria palmicola]
MPIQETLDFESDAYRQVVATASTEWLRQQEVIATRKEVLSSFGVGVGVSGIVATGGVSFLFAAYKARSLYVASKKLELIQAELQKRNVELHKFSKSKDFLGPIAVGAVGVAVGAEVTGLIDGITNIEQMGTGLADGASPSTGLLDNPSEALQGAGGAIEQVVDAITGDAGTTAAVATTDAIAYHAGMIQAQTVAQEMGQTAAEKLFFSAGQPSPECKRSLGVTGLSCNECRANIKQGAYWHCCSCHDDNYDICQSCYNKNRRCKDAKHVMKRLETPSGADFIDRISEVPGYSLWKPGKYSSISRSELNQTFLFQCNFCRAEVRQGRVFHCFECGSFDLCDECYLLGKRCDGGHTLVSGLCAVDSSNSPGFIRDCPGSRDSVPRFCSSCVKPANQGRFYHCCACEDKPGSDHYNICHACYSNGSRCMQSSQHILLLYLMTGGDHGTKYPKTCTRKGSSTRKFKKGGSCTRCQSLITSGTFFHCCQCPGGGGTPDDFDLCLRCYRAGRTCLNEHHLLTQHHIK